MTALLLALKSLGGWLLENALDPRFWAVLAIAVACGFVKGCSFDAQHFKEWRESVERIGAAQEAWTKKRNAAGAAANKEVVNALVQGQQILARDNGALRQRLQRIASGSVFPGPAVSSGGGAFGDFICVERARLDAEAGRHFAERAEQLARERAALGGVRLALAACLQWDDAQRAVAAALPAPVPAAGATSPPTPR